MTRPSKRELEREVEEAQTAASVDLADSEAYALLLGAASGDETAAERWSNVDERQRERVTANL